MFGGQLGSQISFGGGSRLSLAGAYYYFDNIAGERNAFESRLLDFTAPEYLQKGNTLFDIRNDADPNTSLFALASDFELVNGTLIWESGPLFYSQSGRGMGVSLIADYVRNEGWDSELIAERTGSLIEERTEGYQVRLEVGHSQIREFGDWSFATWFRHLERDAVIDAYADSEFHLGGTDTEGWGVDMELGLSDSTSVNLRYTTANEIDGPPLGIDIIQVDLNARF